MSRFVKFTLYAFVALIAFAAVVRTEEKYYDDDGNDLIVFDSKIGDNDFEDDAPSKRSLNIRGKSAYGMAARHKNERLFTSGPSDNEKLIDHNIKITWYASEDLKAPACSNGKWDPSNSNHIGAVMKGWDGGPQCGQFVRLCNDKTSVCVKVRIVDECAGCSKNHVDLTKSAFKKLATTGTLDEGITTGLKLWDSHKPNPWDFSLYGPVAL
ncbi:hypothetical protein MVES1_002104 [Malassezia vespertilionis]|uniref:Barwin domain-containing protein n=1 Tax=Malassezia vespertilionis TaxID=2020962 RepID=A0A2N1JBG7_9BASI|nr:uncharacterized protein MVES1_002104 [Malassezia vespertilionis]PKI83885.1 hypothetical protein MVES_001987 [Malassezia vespertilionis]WFD06750.1 hypothetical protein MVES1_002104 [Malassezia vespertilionis]